MAPEDPPTAADETTVGVSLDDGMPDAPPSAPPTDVTHISSTVPVNPIPFLEMATLAGSTGTTTREPLTTATTTCEPLTTATTTTTTTTTTTEPFTTLRHLTVVAESFAAAFDRLNHAIGWDRPRPRPVPSNDHEGPDDFFYRARLRDYEGATRGASISELDIAAREALLATLSPAQRETSNRWSFWDLTVPATGRVYRVVQVASGNIYRHADRMRYCLAHASGYAPMWVALRCQVWLLLHDEGRFLHTANSLGTVEALPGERFVGRCPSEVRRPATPGGPARATSLGAWWE